MEQSGSLLGDLVGIQLVQSRLVPLDRGYFDRRGRRLLFHPDANLDTIKIFELNLPDLKDSLQEFLLDATSSNQGLPYVREPEAK